MSYLTNYDPLFVLKNGEFILKEESIRRVSRAVVNTLKNKSSKEQKHIFKRICQELRITSNLDELKGHPFEKEILLHIKEEDKAPTKDKTSKIATELIKYLNLNSASLSSLEGLITKTYQTSSRATTAKLYSTGLKSAHHPEIIPIIGALSLLIQEEKFRICA